MSQKTLIVALAVTLNGDAPLAFPAFEDLFDGVAEHVSVVGVLDRGNPDNNYEPQIFASWPAEQARLTLHEGREHAA